MRRALIVGINNYDFGVLSGCVEDARRMYNLLSFNQDGRRNFDCTLLTSPGSYLLKKPTGFEALQTLPKSSAPDTYQTTPNSKITRAELKRNLEDAFRNDDDIDIALFYFAGHGLQTSTGGSLVTQDAQQYDEGLAMNEVLALANRATLIREIVIIADCCHSGVLGQNSSEGAQANLRKGVSILTSSRENQPSVEIGGGGMFTTRVCEALDGGAADILGQVTVASVYSYVHQLFGAAEQRPMFKANLSKLAPLRKCTPAIAIETLYKLPNYFPQPDYEYRLDPSYEPTAKPKNEEHETIFSHLQKYRAARLLEPIGAEHMYWAAMKKKSCGLTPLGKYYWKLASEGRID